MRLRILLGDLDAEQPMPAAISSTRIGPLWPFSTTAPSGPAIGPIIGAIFSANCTQTGLSGSTVPSPGSAVRPLRTTSARLCVRCCICPDWT